jgi:hypothetical protein|tara:strand:+ start:396 stop:722 length:327 start_codon:yes stop_codon:yes gene_type:complete
MRSLEQQIAIAESMGLKLCQHALTDLWGHTVDGVKWETFPDYLTDLNAVRAVVKTLTSKQREEYILRLCSGNGWRSAELNIEDAIFAESAPPEQRVEQILKTLKLWKP